MMDYVVTKFNTPEGPKERNIARADMEQEFKYLDQHGFHLEDNEVQWSREFKGLLNDTQYLHFETPDGKFLSFSALKCWVFGYIITFRVKGIDRQGEAMSMQRFGVFSLLFIDYSGFIFEQVRVTDHHGNVVEGVDWTRREEVMRWLRSDED